MTLLYNMVVFIIILRRGRRLNNTLIFVIKITSSKRHSKLFFYVLKGFIESAGFYLLSSITTP